MLWNGLDRALDETGCALGRPGNKLATLLLEGYKGGYKGLKVREATLPKTSRDSLRAGVMLVKLYEEWGKPDRAAEWRKKLSEATNAP